MVVFLCHMEIDEFCLQTGWLTVNFLVMYQIFKDMPAMRTHIFDSFVQYSLHSMRLRVTLEVKALMKVGCFAWSKMQHANIRDQ